jgi:exodeoxyribonuclease VIII
MLWWDEFQLTNAGRKLVSHEAYELCQAQLAAVRIQPDISRLLSTGRGEVSIFWVDPATGIYCKARPDWLPKDDGASIMPLDLKTTADESPSGFSRAAARLRYDLQDAHYTAGIEEVMGLRVDAFVFGAVSSKPPILAVPYVLTDEIRDQGKEEREELMQKLVWCKRENQWPAYGDGFQMLDFPAYAKNSGEVEIEWIES